MISAEFERAHIYGLDAMRVGEFYSMACGDGVERSY